MNNWHYCAQRSEDWFRLRLGKVTSTRLQTVALGTMSAQTALLNRMQDEIENPDKHIEEAMLALDKRDPAPIKLGKEREDWLRARFEIRVTQDSGKPPKMDLPGFVDHPAVDRFGCSPDWFLTSPYRAPGEGKVRTDPELHAFAIKRGLLPKDKCQVYAHMMCTESTEADYVSYCPFWGDEKTQVHIVRVKYDKQFGDYLYAELAKFLEHLENGTRPTMPKGLSGIPSFY